MSEPMPSMTVVEMLRKNVALYPDEVALVAEKLIAAL